MAHKYEHVSTGEGFKVKKSGVETQALDVAVKDLTAAQIIGMFDTPVEVVPAKTGYSIFVEAVVFEITRTSTAFTGGGTVAVQYDDTAESGGTATHATIAATVVTGSAGQTHTHRIPVVLSDVANSAIEGIGLYISNASAAFAAGTGTARVSVWYRYVKSAS